MHSPALACPIRGLASFGCERMTRTIDLTFTRQDKAASHYHYLPFDVPDGTTRIDIGFALERSDHCQLDFGLHRPDGHRVSECDRFAGLVRRGARRLLHRHRRCHPGYLHGPIVSGEWRVVIGLCNVPAGGAALAVTIRLDAAPRPVKAEPVRTDPVRKGGGWYRGDLHCHTYHSDAQGSPETLHAAARQAGLDFLAVADHNTTTQRGYFYPASSADLVFVRATEVTTNEGHANAFGVEGMIDYRLTRPGDVHRLVDHVHARGGILSINHDKPTIPWRYELPRADCMEVWQSTWIEWNWISLARYQHRLAAGLRISAIGGSDYHQPADLKPEGPFVLARPTTVLYLDELSESSVIEAMKAGNGYITGRSERAPPVDHRGRPTDGQPRPPGERGARRGARCRWRPTGLDRCPWGTRKHGHPWG